MLCDVSGSMEPYTRAYLQFLHLRRRRRRRRRGVRLRHPPHPAHAGAGARATRTAPSSAPPPRRRDWASGTRIGDALQGVQRPARPPRHGPRRGRGDPLRRLGARRPGARRRARWRGCSRLAHRIVWVNPRTAAPRLLGRAPAAWSPRCRTATRSSAATAYDALGEVVAAIGASGEGAAPCRASPGAAGARGRGGRAVGQRDAGPRQLGRDAERLRPEPRPDDAGMAGLGRT